jgi:hypothetical protein
VLGQVGVRFEDIWARRCGRSAAKHYLRTLELAILFALVTPTWLAAFIVASVYKVPALHVAGFVLVAAQVVLFIFAELQLHRFHLAASKQLKVKVGWNEPPSSQQKFDLWCQARGVKASEE